MQSEQTIYRCGDCQLDVGNRSFTRSGTEHVLEPKVFAVLAQLLGRPGKLLTRDQLLDAVWGHHYVTPSTLNRVISLARRALSDDADGPKLIQTVHGAGYRYVGTTEFVSSAAGEPRARFGPPPAARLPARLQTLIGRENELSQIGGMLNEGRSLTILGTGGMGKTQCALAFGHGSADSYQDGIWFFDLIPIYTADEWLRTLALSLSIEALGQTELLAKIVHSLAGRRALLLIDNCDRLSTDMGALVVELLRGTDSLKVLATSQQPLNFIGERVLRLPPLRLPTIRHPTGEAELMEVAGSPAVSLLVARIRDIQTEFRMTIRNAPAIADICERLDGMPLALELAAARFALLSPEQVLDRLDERFRFLTSNISGRDYRHRNLIALLEWSFGLLSLDEQRLLSWLAVFVQGWTVDAVIGLAASFGSTAEAIVGLLSGLADKSLVVVDQSQSPPRYRLLESVREFALDQLRISDQEAAARDTHLAHVIRMAETVHKDMLCGRMRECIALIMPEHGNISAACEHALGAAGNYQAALKIVGGLTLYFKAHGAWPFGRSLCEEALASAPPARTRERALALICLGVNRVMGEKTGADSPLLEAAVISLELGDDWTAAYSSGWYALWLSHMGRPVEAFQHLAILERTVLQLDDGILSGLAGLARGWAHLAQGDVDESINALLQVRHVGGDYHQHHFVDMYIGLALFRRGDLARAAFHWLEAMRNAIAVGHPRGTAGAVEGCAYIAEQMGRSEQCCRLLSAAAKIRKRTEMPLFSFWYHHNEQANAAARSALGPRQYEEASAEGARMRQEDVVNQAAESLGEFSASVA